MKKRAKVGVWSLDYVHPLILKKKRKNNETNYISAGITTKNEDMTRGIYYPILRMLRKIYPSFPYNEEKLYLTYDEKMSLKDEEDTMDAAGKVKMLVHQEDEEHHPDQQVDIEEKMCGSRWKDI
jgi:hypothetical protein